MTTFMEEHRLLIRKIKTIIVVLVCALINAYSVNYFLVPAHLFSSGFFGLAQLISDGSAIYHLPVQLSLSTMYLLLNLPVIYLAWAKLGRFFTITTMISIVATTFFLGVIPTGELTHNGLLNAVFGGVIGGVGIGYTLKYGSSTGGLDIVAIVIAKIKDSSMGNYMMALNTLIIIGAGIMYNAESALYTLVSLYAKMRVIDIIHTKHMKLAAHIVTTKQKEVKYAIYRYLGHGVTEVECKGGFYQQNQTMLYCVMSRHELYKFEMLMKEIDPNAFVTITQVMKIMGRFVQKDKV